MSRLVYTPKNINNTPANPFEIQNLSVLGNASIAGSLSAGATSVSSLSSGGTAVLNNATVAGTLGVSGISTLGVVNSGNHAVTGTLSSSGLATLNSLSVTTSAAIGTSATVGTTLGVSGLLSANGGLTIVGALTLPVASQLQYQIVTLYMSSLVAADSIVSVIPAKITGTIVEITAVSNAVLAVGSAIFTCAIVNSGVSTNITNGAPTITTGTGIFNPVTVTPSGNNTLISGSVLKCQISGGNTQISSGTVSFKVLVA